MKKYNTFTLNYAISTVKESGVFSLSKIDGYTDEEFAFEVENLKKEFEDTGYFYEYYPPGSIYDIEYFFTDFEDFGVTEDKKEALLEYIDEKLPGYSYKETKYGTIKLIPDENYTVQERFDVVRQLYNDFDVIHTLSSEHLHWCDVGNSIKLLEDTQPMVTTTVTTATETTTTTVSTTATTVTTISPATTPAETTTTTTITTQPPEQAKSLGDANGDNELNVRDCAFIAAALAQGRNDELMETADFNGDGEVNVRDAAAVARKLATKNMV